MTEFLEPGGGVRFADLPVRPYIKLPRGSLAEFEPADTDGTHLAASLAFADHDVEQFMAIELTPDPIPWADGLYQEAVGRTRDLADSFADKLGFLKQVDDTISFGSKEGIIERMTPQFVRDATAIYAEMLGLTAKVYGWDESQQLETRSALLAELSMPDVHGRRRAWRFWNDLAIDYTQTKLQRVRDVLRQPAA